MKPLKSCFVFAVAMAISHGATAGNGVPFTLTDTAPSPTQADWSGFYIGGLGALGDSSLDVFNSGNFQSQYDSEGELYGAFAGYNFQSGNLVYGGELAYLAGLIESPDASHTVSTENHLDFKLRAGYATGNILLFGFGGYSTMTMNEGSSSPVSIDGFNFGAGAEILISDRFIVGLEFTSRQASGDADPDVYPTISLSGPVNTIGIRAGIKF